MNAEDREQIRLSIIRHLDARRFGLATPILQQLIRTEGFSGITRDEIEVETQYLVDKGFVAEVPKPLSPENRTWRITAEGRDYRAQQNL